MVVCFIVAYIYGLVQDCSNSIANALVLLQSCTKPSISSLYFMKYTFCLIQSLININFWNKTDIYNLILMMPYFTL